MPLCPHRSCPKPPPNSVPVCSLRGKPKGGARKLSRVAQIYTGQLRAIEHGRRNPGLEIVVKLADALGIRAGELVDDLPVPPRDPDYRPQASEPVAIERLTLPHPVAPMLATPPGPGAYRQRLGVGTETGWRAP
ncbi:MAG: helix-turn-helix domain-containing protein, partial [Pseudonocardiaceae bacterium]|nr:helix-turn-helix domain-containing protein [Pseudonocardiaceae bacterium]